MGQGAQGPKEHPPPRTRRNRRIGHIGKRRRTRGATIGFRFFFVFFSHARVCRMYAIVTRESTVQYHKIPSDSCAHGRESFAQAQYGIASIRMKKRGLQSASLTRSRECGRSWVGLAWYGEDGNRSCKLGTTSTSLRRSVYDRGRWDNEWSLGR